MQHSNLNDVQIIATIIDTNGDKYGYGGGYDCDAYKSYGVGPSEQWFPNSGLMAKCGHEKFFSLSNWSPMATKWP